MRRYLNALWATFSHVVVHFIDDSLLVGIGFHRRLSACVYFPSARRFIHANGMRIRLWNVGASSLHKNDSKASHRLRYLTAHPTPLNCATNDALPRPSAASSESFITKFFFFFFIFKLTRLVVIVVNTFHWFALSADLPPFRFT